jgi:hypothetical protein
MKDDELHIVRGSGINNGIVVHSNGGVSIETDYLPSTYSLAVNGKAICEELRVDLFAAWPDYVFEPEYELMPLKEVREVLAEQKHLPGMPSATEVQDNGQMVGEIQLKLLEKVEELMLYVIGLEEKTDLQAERIEKLELENSGLRRLILDNTGKEDK